MTGKGPLCKSPRPSPTSNISHGAVVPPPVKQLPKTRPTAGHGAATSGCGGKTGALRVRHQDWDGLRSLKDIQIVILSDPKNGRFKPFFDLQVHTRGFRFITNFGVFWLKTLTA